MQFDLYDFVSGSVSRLARDAELRFALLRAVRDQAIDMGMQVARVNPSAINFLNYIVAPYAYCPTKPRMIAEIARDDMTKLFQAGVRLGRFDGNGKISLESVVVRTVFGATEQMPVRAISYLLPALHLLESLRRSGKFSLLPQIQYVIMGNSGSRINGLNEKEVLRQSTLFAEVGMRYMEHTYPDLVDQITFAYDSGFLEHPEVAEYRTRLQRASGEIKHHEMYQSAIGKIEARFGASGAEYALLHALVHDALYKKEPFLPIRGSNRFVNQPNVMINIGGQNEKIFYSARKIYLETVRNNNIDIPILPSIQLFTTHKVPPYMSIKEENDRLGDIHLADAINCPRMLFDLEVRLAMSGALNNLLKRDYDDLSMDSSGTFSYCFEQIAANMKTDIYINHLIQ
ncbi:MAG: hypothetical protein Q7R79_03850 [bacterium]|nr:hypothetical protein [bacterium]